MDRLTEHVGAEFVYIKDCRTLYAVQERKGASAANAIARLAAYEDAMSLERAQELARAEKDGRLVMLEPNEPLTPQELEAMDGMPVWVESFVRCIESHWAIVHGKYLSDGRFPEDKNRCLLSFDDTGGYGVAFRVYRRKP